MRRESGKWNSLRMAYDAILAAMCAVLGYIGIDFGVSKLTFENLPVVIGALMFGPIDGMIIGAVGTFAYQLVRYGFDPTTVLWMIPYIASGLLVGLFAKRVDVSGEWKTAGEGTFWQRFFDDFKQNGWKLVLLLIADSLLVIALNSAVLYICYKYFYYMNTATIFTSLSFKIPVGTLKAVIYAIVIPILLRGLKAAGLYKQPWKKRNTPSEEETK